MFSRNIRELQEMQERNLKEIEFEMGEQVLLKKRIRKDIQHFVLKT